MCDEKTNTKSKTIFDSCLTRNMSTHAINLVVVATLLAAICVFAQTPTPFPNPCLAPANAPLPFCNVSLKIEDRVSDLVARLSRLPPKSLAPLFQFAAGGVAEMHIPPYEWWSEGLHGVAFSPGVNFTIGPSHAATSFPQVCTTAATYNKSLFTMIGATVGREGRSMNNDKQAGLTYWAPNINIYRDPRWGRGQETPGEDPFLTATYAHHFVRAMQNSSVDATRLQVSACCKHFTAYDMDRWGGEDRHIFNAIVSEQDMWDTFMPSFEACIHHDGGAASGVMCSYNAVNGVPMCANKPLLDNITLRWGFEGYVTSDCGAVGDVMYNHHFTKTPDETLQATLGAGMDVDCGGMVTQYFASAVANGTLRESAWHRALTRQFTTLMRLGLFDPAEDQPFKQWTAANVSDESARHLALTAAQEGVVMLNYDVNVLPLDAKANQRIAIMGPHANATWTLLGNYNGQPPYMVSPLDGVRRYAKHVDFIRGVGVTSFNATEFDAACRLAAKSDVVVLVMGLSENVEDEGLDRYRITLPGLQSVFIHRMVACAAGKPVILVSMSGGSVDYSEFMALPGISAIMWAGYAGQSGGQAIADVIYGSVSPSGRLPHTVYPADFVDLVTPLDMQMEANQTSGNPGRTYRYYTGNAVYPFAWGLTYTNWSVVPVSYRTGWRMQHAVARAEEWAVSCSDVEAIISEDRLATRESVGAITFNLTNTGDRASAFSLLLFARFPQPSPMVGGQLVDFEKAKLEPGQSTLVTLQSFSHAFSTYDATAGRRRCVPGQYQWRVPIQGTEHIVGSLRVQ